MNLKLFKVKVSNAGNFVSYLPWLQGAVKMVLPDVLACMLQADFGNAD